MQPLRSFIPVWLNRLLCRPPRQARHGLPPKPGGNPYNQDQPADFSESWIGSAPYLALINERITGDPSLHWLDFALRTYVLPGSGPDTACLLLGSNEGSMEIALRQAGFPGRIVATDIADKALARARVRTAELGLAGIEHVVADLNRDTFPDGSFDLVIAEGVLHHVENIDFCLSHLRAAMKPNGRLIAMEFAGAFRFQLPRIQVDWINAVLAAVPRRYRPVDPQGSPGSPPKGRDLAFQIYVSPSVDAMIALDPSEAVSGHLLMEALARRFDLDLVREAGGSLLMYMTGHFPFQLTNTDPACADWLRIMAGTERVLYEQKIVPSDLVFLVARPKAA